jgi:Cu/Ag efflux protein CusF
MVTLAHEPIKALNWPAMTMSFKVANNIDMSNIELKQTIYFELQKTANSYEITKISRTNK